MNLARISESMIRKLKRDDSYSIQSTYSNRQFFSILIERCKQIARGSFKRIWIGKSNGIIFVGRRVVIEHAYALRTGRSLILEDNVYLNALSKNGIIFGSNVTIAKGSILVCTGVISQVGTGIEIGDNSAVGAQSFLGGQGGIKIGTDVIMGPQVKIFSENHNYAHPALPIRKQGESRRGVVIGDNCWIGAGVTIVDGVTVGDGVVVAAGAVVTNDIPANSICVGVPARVLKSRF